MPKNKEVFVVEMQKFGFNDSEHYILGAYENLVDALLAAKEEESKNINFKGKVKQLKIIFDSQSLKG